MNTAVVSVSHAGPHVSIQDAGRRGLMRFGVPQSGPMDRLAHAAANAALGNPAGSAAIEVSLGGLALECLSGRVSFAIAGGAFAIDHAGQRRASWTVATLDAGDRLAIRPGASGSWCYLAFAGALQVPRWLGSAATHAMSGLGGGRVVSGQKLTVGNAARRDDREGDIPRWQNPRPGGAFRATIGPQQRFFGAETVSAFLNGPWRMSDARDRMGARLTGPPIEPRSTLDMPSEAILRGSVQVAGDGVPTVLLADHQTTGGYPKIAALLDCDLDDFVQLRPQDPVVFRQVSPDEAVTEARGAASANRRYLDAISRPRGGLDWRLLNENLIGGVVDASGD
ncbi:biotin-dependent carboxyltransferase family protein [Sedimentitalea sp. JM2-8]|uniref:Biotin-dependent carboxyltransferase family protein n=1 Tax=Sedimentitalea xiamensis TaxID=3050037 RepID=A0ABT7FHC1_9RHOB|nr:biotin-dependent carboxyltransferase family protein [Sedimentitalea xiamensis]MDK3074487.1 biotin-dependent carboxyltransferase family protein [Sedimentitalea xiamensis]